MGAPHTQSLKMLKEQKRDCLFATAANNGYDDIDISELMGVSITTVNKWRQGQRPACPVNKLVQAIRKMNRDPKIEQPEPQQKQKQAKQPKEHDLVVALLHSFSNQDLLNELNRRLSQ
jgi:hypothetical protein